MNHVPMSMLIEVVTNVAIVRMKILLILKRKLLNVRVFEKRSQNNKKVVIRFRMNSFNN
jgi:hypothetical protein